MSQCLVVAPDRLLLDLELAPVRKLIDCFFELHIFYLIVEVHKTKPPGVEASRVALYLPCGRISMPPFCKRAWHDYDTTKISLMEERLLTLKQLW